MVAPDRAIELAETLPGERERHAALTSVVAAMADTDPEQALTAAGRITDTAQRARSLARVAPELAVTTPIARSRWPEPTRRRSLASRKRSPTSTPTVEDATRRNRLLAHVAGSRLDVDALVDLVRTVEDDLSIIVTVLAAFVEGLTPTDQRMAERIGTAETEVAEAKRRCVPGDDVYRRPIVGSTSTMYPHVAVAVDTDRPLLTVASLFVLEPVRIVNTHLPSSESYFRK